MYLFNRRCCSEFWSRAFWQSFLFYSRYFDDKFFPTKPLSCFGDGGAIFSKDEKLIQKANIISKNGQSGRYNYLDVGVNSRLDTIQAAIILEKLKIFDSENKRKQEIASKYMILSYQILME